MTGFIRELLSMRNNASLTQQSQGMEAAINEMTANGIVGVGDISNLSVSAELKQNSTIRFHTFVEVLGIDPSKAAETVTNANKLVSDFDIPPNSAALTPHAPYSVSDVLMQSVSESVSKTGNPLAIHLQESEDELEYYKYGTGPMAGLFREMGFTFPEKNFSGQSPVYHILPMLKKVQKLIFVHNTYVTSDEIAWAEKQHPGIYWCLCPKANLYITNGLPPVDDLNKYAHYICIGTDSLASNDTLSILEELRIVNRAFPSIPFETLIQWGTINGACALNMQNTLGSITSGKTPGLNLLENINPADPVIDGTTTLKKIK